MAHRRAPRMKSLQRSLPKPIANYRKSILKSESVDDRLRLTENCSDSGGESSRQPPKSVSFHELAVYPSIIHNAIRSISPKKFERSISDDPKISLSSSIKKSISDYYIEGRL